MAKFEIEVARVLAHEGGYVWNKFDSGGETNLGITDRLDGKIDGLVDVNGDSIGDVEIKNLTEAQAKQVYKTRFWDKMQGDKIESQAIAGILFDGYVNMGATAIKILQRILGLNDDGVIGPKTLEAINGANEIQLYTNYKAARIEFYADLAERKPALKVFLKGWNNRINSFPDLA